jgi:phage tail-like protein
MRDRPCANSNFLVDVGTADPRSASAGFSEVIFPTFTLDGAVNRSAEAADAGESTSTGTAASPYLVLKRGVVGSLDLYAWWHKARRGKAPQRRTVKVELLAEDGSTVVLRWRFRNARPVSLSYSPLRAVEGNVVIETLELAFDSMEMS